MNEQEISALINELLSEQRAKKQSQALSDEAELSEELIGLAAEDAEARAGEVVSHAKPGQEDFAEDEDDSAEEAADSDGEAAPPAADSADGSPAHAHIPDAQTRRSRLYAALDAQPDAEPDVIPRQKYRTREILMGLILVLLAAYGIYALVLRGIDRIHVLNETQDSAARDAAAACILPLVITDMPEFSDPGELTDEQFLIVSVWAAAAQGKLAGYEERFDMVTVPAADLTALGNQLFGVNRSPAYHTIGFSGELRFYYDSESDSYLLPADPELFTYEPVIREMQQTDAGDYTVTADYVAEQPAWKHGDPVTVKTMRFTLTEQNGTWQVRAAALVQ